MGGDMKHRISTGKMILAIIAAVAVLVAAQSMALAVGSAAVHFGLPPAVGSLIAGVLYPIITFGGIWLVCGKLLKLPMKECRITGFRLKPVWIITAFMMPIITSAILLLTDGHWENNTLEPAQVCAVTVQAVFYYGLGAGIVEEMVFRGVIMSALEYRFHKIAAVAAPSILFGALHIIGNDLDFLSAVQLLIAGSVVGILFSLVTYESGSIWNSALIHGIWNAIIMCGILHIGDTADAQAVYNYVLESKSFLITGGDFGIEASAVSVSAYTVFILLAVKRLRRKKECREK